MKLSDCRHSGIGVHNCAQRHEEAGVLCNSKWNFSLCSIISFPLAI